MVIWCCKNYAQSQSGKLKIQSCDDLPSFIANFVSIVFFFFTLDLLKKKFFLSFFLFSSSSSKTGFDPRWMLKLNDQQVLTDFFFCPMTFLKIIDFFSILVGFHSETDWNRDIQLRMCKSTVYTSKSVCVCVCVCVDECRWVCVCVCVRVCVCV